MNPGCPFQQICELGDGVPAKAFLQRTGRASTWKLLALTMALSVACREQLGNGSTFLAYTTFHRAWGKGFWMLAKYLRNSNYKPSFPSAASWSVSFNRNKHPCTHSNQYFIASRLRTPIVQSTFSWLCPWYQNQYSISAAVDTTMGRHRLQARVQRRSFRMFVEVFVQVKQRGQ